MKTIIVTGAAGFIGSNLCEKLLSIDNNCIVIGVDNYSSGQRSHFDYLSKKFKSRFVPIQKDICNINKNSFKYWNIDEIYNAACMASPVFYQNNPIDTLKTSTIGVINLLELAKKHKAKFLQFSTSEVYGDPLEHPQKETYFGNVNINGPRACYDEGKRVAETLCMEYNKVYGVKTSIVRIFNTYGPGMRLDDGRVITNFIKQILDNKPVTIYGDGTQTRSFCYIDDLLDGIIKLMESDETSPVNIGNPTEITLLELVEKLEKVFGKSVEKVYLDLPKDDPQKRKPDITKASIKLDWSPKIDLETGLNSTINYFKEIR